MVCEFGSKCINDYPRHQIDSTPVFGCVVYLARAPQDFAGNPENLAILGHVLVVPLFRCHSLELLHPAANEAGVVGKIEDTVRNYFLQTLDQSRNDSDRIPQQGTIGRVMDVSLYDCCIDAEFLAILDFEIDGGLDHQIINGLKCCGRQPVKGSVKGVVLGNAIAVEMREQAQGVTIGDSFSQFAVVQILYPHENQRAQNLLGS